MVHVAPPFYFICCRLRTLAAWRSPRSTTKKYSARFFNYLIWWFRVLVVVRVWDRVTVGARDVVGVGLVRG